MLITTRTTRNLKILSHCHINQTKDTSFNHLYTHLPIHSSHDIQPFSHQSIVQCVYEQFLFTHVVVRTSSWNRLKRNTSSSKNRDKWLAIFIYLSLSLSLSLSLLSLSRCLIILHIGIISLLTHESCVIQLI